MTMKFMSMSGSQDHFDDVIQNDRQHCAGNDGAPKRVERIVQLDPSLKSKNGFSVQAAANARGVHTMLCMSLPSSRFLFLPGAAIGYICLRPALRERDRDGVAATE